MQSRSKTSPEIARPMLLSRTDIVSTSDKTAQARLLVSRSPAVSHRETRIGWRGAWQRRQLDEWPSQAAGMLAFDESAIATPQKTRETTIRVAHQWLS